MGFGAPQAVMLYIGYGATQWAQLRVWGFCGCRALGLPAPYGV